MTQRYTDTDSVAGAEVHRGSGRVSNLIRSNPKRELVQVQAAATLQASRHPVLPGCNDANKQDNVIYVYMLVGRDAKEEIDVM